MDAYEYTELLRKLNSKIQNIKNIVKPQEIEQRVQEIEEMQQVPSFWEDSTHASKISQEKTVIERLKNKYDDAYMALSDAKIFLRWHKVKKMMTR